jgi:hypothetical protein
MGVARSKRKSGAGNVNTARARSPRRSAVKRSVLRSASAEIQIRYRGNVEYCGGEVGCAGVVRREVERRLDKDLLVVYQRFD